MPTIPILKFNNSTSDFKVLHTEQLTQVAVLNLAPGEATSEKPSHHPESEQTLLVLEGELDADIEGETLHLQRGDCVIVPKNGGHRFINHGSRHAKAYTSYSPPCY